MDFLITTQYGCFFISIQLDTTVSGKLPETVIVNTSIVKEDGGLNEKNTSLKNANHLIWNQNLAFRFVEYIDLLPFFGILLASNF